MSAEISNSNDDDSYLIPKHRLVSHPPKPWFNLKEGGTEEIIATNEGTIRKSPNSNGWRRASALAVWLGLTFAATKIMPVVLNIPVSAEEEDHSSPPSTLTTEIANLNFAVGIPDDLARTFYETPQDTYAYRGLVANKALNYQILIDQNLMEHPPDSEFLTKISNLLDIVSRKIDSNAAGLLSNSIIHVKYVPSKSGSGSGENYTLYLSDQNDNVDLYGFVPALEVRVPPGFDIEEAEIAADVLESLFKAALVLSDGSEESISDIYALRNAVYESQKGIPHNKLPADIQEVLNETDYSFFAAVFFNLPGVYESEADLN